MKINKWFYKFLEKSKILIDNARTILIVLLVILFIVSACINGWQRNKMNELFSNITGIKIENRILEKSIAKKTGTISEQEKEINTLNFQRDSLSYIIDSLKNDIKLKEKEKNKNPKEIIDIPADSSYQFLNEVAYPYPGMPEYPFNEAQVKNIHLTYNENIDLELINSMLYSLVGKYESQDKIEDSIIVKQKENLYLALENQKEYKKIVNNHKEIIKKLEERNKKNEKRKKLWRTLTTGTTAGLIILTLIII